MIGFGNRAPWLELSDQALADRLKVIPYRKIPENKTIPGLKAAFEEEGDTSVRQAMLSILVKYGCRYRKEMPPLPEEIDEETERVRVESMSPVEIWLKKRVQRQPEIRLSTTKAWKSWVDDCGRDSGESGSRRSFVQALKKHCGVSTLNRFKEGSKVVQGVQGWTVRRSKLHSVACVLETPPEQPCFEEVSILRATECNQSENPPEKRSEMGLKLIHTGNFSTHGDETLWETMLMVILHRDHPDEKNPHRWP